LCHTALLALKVLAGHDPSADGSWVEFFELATRRMRDLRIPGPMWKYELAHAHSLFPVLMTLRESDCLVWEYGDRRGAQLQLGPDLEGVDLTAFGAGVQASCGEWEDGATELFFSARDLLMSLVSLERGVVNIVRMAESAGCRTQEGETDLT